LGHLDKEISPPGNMLSLRGALQRVRLKDSEWTCFSSMLQPGLWPLMQIERVSRTYFTLRLLLGYPRRVCAQLLDVEESKIETLLQTAIDTRQPSRAETH
jgi:hypothetical protein